MKHKKNRYVWIMKGSSTVGGIGASTPDFYIAGDGNYELCITAKGTGSLEVTGGTSGYSASFGGYSNGIFDFKTANYTMRCMNYKPHQGQNKLYLGPRYAGVEIYLLQVTINRTLPTPTAPNPAPAK